jgi:hypothetical protein
MSNIIEAFYAKKTIELIVIKDKVFGEYYNIQIDFIQGLE